MRLSACLVLLLLVPWTPGASAGATDTHLVDIEVRLDRSERIVWRFTSYDGVMAFTLPDEAELVLLEGARGALNGSRIEFEQLTRSATLTLTLPPPEESLHPLYSRRIALPDGMRVEASIAVPEGFRLFHASLGGLTLNATRLEYAGHGGADLVYAYRAPMDPDLGVVELDEGIYHIVAPARSEAAVRRIAALASEASAYAADLAGIPLPSPLWVRFAPDRAFGEEAGYYGSDGIIAIRREELSSNALDGHPWRAAETLVHETFHAASLPLGDPRLAQNVTWWLEGSARFSERFVSGVDGWRACDAGWCVTFQGQLNASQVRSAYDGSFGFLPGWASHNEARYRHAAYLVGAYVDRYGVDAYRAVWSDLRDASGTASCACDDAWLLQRLVLHSGGRATRDEIYRPFGDLRQDDRAAFDARVAHLVAQEPRAGAPEPWRPAFEPSGAVPVSAQRRLAVAPPSVAAPDLELRARVEGISLLEDEDPPGSPDARLVVRVDGEATAPASLTASRGNVTVSLANLSVGVHRVELEAVTLHGGALEPRLRGEVTFIVHPGYALALDPFPAGVYTPPVLLSGVVMDASTGAPLGDVALTLEVEGEGRREARSDPLDGRFAFEVLSLPTPETALRVLVADANGLVLAEATTRLPPLPATPTDAPLDGHGVPAAGVESTGGRGVPVLGGAALVVALSAGAALRRRAR